MLWTRYRSHPVAAMPGRILIITSLLLALLAGCQKSEISKSGGVAAKPKVTQMAEAPQSAEEIMRLMQQAQDGERIGAVLAELDSLAGSAASPIAEEAQFRKAQLMLERDLPGAGREAASVISKFPRHALVPYAHFWLTKWWLTQGEADRALAEMAVALRSPLLTRELADGIFELGPSLSVDASEQQAVAWLFAAAEIDKNGRDSWLRMAARRASMQTIDQLHSDPSVSRDLLPQFDLNAGRSRLMVGDIEGVSHIAELLSHLMPGHANIRQLRAWAAGENRAATIGVMLPLSGTYAKYGEEALRGIRIALASIENEGFITLRVEDTASSVEGAITAYKRLSEASVNMIVGPLLAECTEALIPYMRDDLPMISMTGRIDLALQSKALFVHTLSPLAQVYVMADYAWQHGVQRMVVISDAGENQAEADMMAKSFMALGGEVIQTVQLDAGAYDYRDRLRQLRYDTDDEQHFMELDEELNVFLPEMDMEIRMLPNFDAVYLAMDGKQVSLIAGQLAYADIVDLPIFGSSRWQDGHLLDDRGRYLTKARFAGSSVATDEATTADDPTERQFQFRYREAWGTQKPTPLMRLSFDTMRIATVMTSQLGLLRHEIVDAMHDIGGFPALTGHVRFDKDGIGQKQLDIYSIKGGKLVPAG